MLRWVVARRCRRLMVVVGRCVASERLGQWWRIQIGDLDLEICYEDTAPHQLSDAWLSCQGRQAGSEFLQRRGRASSTHTRFHSVRSTLVATPQQQQTSAAPTLENSALHKSAKRPVASAKTNHQGNERRSNLRQTLTRDGVSSPPLVRSGVTRMAVRLMERWLNHRLPRHQIKFYMKISKN
ncbi:hypothetical protein PC115_g20699 [Phytophthora cactorum]|uniref:Uncharacterized protein n=1 Tax=Phytophthora cactorum TaxID=29920 RepID=A0A8T1ASX3_9STRA|nr:hypothetical protein PC115_g20699 [Phytophthora cactorum]